MTISVAAQLGETPHLSPLLRKARLLGLGSADALLRLAVARGCTHYAPPDFDQASVCDPGGHRFSDTELAIALISGAQQFHPQCVRCAAQLLSSSTVPPESASQFAIRERCEAILVHIAQAALRFDAPEHHGRWRVILDSLRPRSMPPAGRLPHPSRFILQTGVTNPAHPEVPHAVWLRPRPVPSR